MITPNDNKGIIDISQAKRVGTLDHYLINRQGEIRAIACIDNGQLSYTAREDIVAIGSKITVQCTSREKPSGLNRCYRISPKATIFDINDKSYDRAEHLNIENKNISSFITITSCFEPSDIVKSTPQRIIFASSILPPKQDADECSFHYEWAIGKIAIRSVYSTSNTPIIIKGEIITISNILNSILENKLIELLNSII